MNIVEDYKRKLKLFALTIMFIALSFFINTLLLFIVPLKDNLGASAYCWLIIWLLSGISIYPLILIYKRYESRCINKLKANLSKLSKDSDEYNILEDGIYEIESHQFLE